ncbi:MAG TPA: D-2-hydroxyacid dehydrogenase [Lachnospiraceae bacterium]|nr:D-2-hydroxyacid dehydrogenase [Lachnospiraceae bacterium]
MKILITVPFTEEQKERLRAQMPEASYHFTDKVSLTDEEIREADIILGNVPVDRLANAQSLKWLQLNYSGADAYAAEGVLAHEVMLTNATGAYGLAISEHLLAVTFFLKKKLGRYHRNQMHGQWKDEGQVTAIAGSRTLVIGLGNIGGEYARKMSLLGSRVTGIRRTKAACPEYLDAIGTFEDLERFLPEADIVAMALPNTPQTRHIMNAERLSMMKKGSILLNVGRGTAIDQDALLHALESGRLAGASIDVTDPEPLPADHPLWHCENLLLTPHVAGDYHLQETLDHIVELFIENLGRYAKGKELLNPVDRKTGYRRTE